VKQSNEISQKPHTKNNYLTHNGKTVTHRKCHGIKYRRATQKKDTTTKFYCTKHGQNPTHPIDKCYILKTCADKAKGTSNLGLTRKSFRKEINILAKGRPRKKILEMFPVVLQQEHTKLSAKTSKKAKKNKIMLDESSDSSDKNMSIDLMTVSTTDKVDRPSNKLMEEMDEDKTYQSRIEYLGITNED
jgi:hypothetical protein